MVYQRKHIRPPAPFAINWKHRERRNVSSVHESGIHTAAPLGRDHGRRGAPNKTLIKRNQRLAPPPRTGPLTDSPVNGTTATVFGLMSDS